MALYYKWLGRFTVAHIDESKKEMYVQDAKSGAARPFNIVQEKNYFMPEVIAHNLTRDIGEKLLRFRSYVADDEGTYLTEVTGAEDPRAQSPEMCETK